MQHRRNRLQLNGKPQHQRMVARNLITSFILYESIRTTRKRAKVLQSLIDGLITTAKRKDPREAIRAISAVVTDANACRKVMEVLKDRFSDRPSGFTRLKPAGARKGDGAELADLEFIILSTPAAAADAKAEKKPATKKPAPRKKVAETAAA
jgi:large subunit ribosomal protein L17